MSVSFYSLPSATHSCTLISVFLISMSFCLTEISLKSSTTSTSSIASFYSFELNSFGEWNMFLAVFLLCQNLQDLNSRTFQGFSSTFKHLICFQTLSSVLKFLFQIQAFQGFLKHTMNPGYLQLCTQNADTLRFLGEIWCTHTIICEVMIHGNYRHSHVFKKNAVMISSPWYANNFDRIAFIFLNFKKCLDTEE